MTYTLGGKNDKQMTFEYLYIICVNKLTFLKVTLGYFLLITQLIVKVIPLGPVYKEEKMMYI